MNKEIIKNIKAILVDVDGVLTDGGIYYDGNGNELKKFNVKDGQIIKYLKNNLIILGVITGRTSIAVDKRVKELGFDFYRKGISDKVESLNEFLNIYNLKTDEVAYMGDDIIDLAILNLVGFSGTPADSRKYIKERVDFIANSKGGDGAFRDFADYILEQNGLFENILEESLK